MRHTGWVWMTLLVLIFSSSAFALPVFPGAMGFGTETTAGRGGQVFRVNTLSDDPNEANTTTLREALESSVSPRTVVFEISGTITITRPIKIRSPFITVAGQTAPSPGILVKGHSIHIITHDVLIQHIAVRPGDIPESDPNSGLNNRDSFIVFAPNDSSWTMEVNNVVLDHVSASWTTDQSLSVYGDHPTMTVHDVTISHALMVEPLHHSIHNGDDQDPATHDDHGFGPFIGGRTARTAMLRNVTAYNEARNPLMKDDSTDILLVNNLVFFPGTYTAAKINFGTKGAADVEMRASIVRNLGIYRSNNQNTPFINIASDAATHFKLYLDGNTALVRSGSNCDDGTWLPASGDQWDTGFTSIQGHALADVRVTTPAVSLDGITVWTSDIKAQVLAHVGSRPADRAKSAAERDPVDYRIIQQIQNCTGTAPVNTPDDVGGYPTLAVNTRTLSIPSDHATDPDGNGYTKLEEMLHTYAAEVEGNPLDPSSVITKDFESGTDSSWSAVGTGTWSRVVDGASTVYRSSDTTGDTRAVLTGSNWTNQSIQADIKINGFADTNRWVGLSARFTDMDNHYYVTLRQTNTIDLRKKVAGTVTTLQSVSFTPELGKWYRIRLEAVGSAIKVYVNNALTLQATDSSLSRGRAALSMWGADAYFDNVVATPNALTQLLASNFDAGTASGWTPGTSNWSVVTAGGSSVYQQSDQAGDAYSTAGSGWTDQIVEADLRATGFNPDAGEDWFGLAARYADFNNHYYVTLRDSNTLMLRKTVGGTFTTLDSASFTVAKDTTYRVRLEAIGSSIKVYIDGVVKLEATDSSLTAGGTALRTFRTAAQYDNVLVLKP